MTYLGKILALFAVITLAVSGLGFSSTAALADDAGAVTKVALSDGEKKDEGKGDEADKKDESSGDAEGDKKEEAEKKDDG